MSTLAAFAARLHGSPDTPQPTRAAAEYGVRWHDRLGRGPRRKRPRRTLLHFTLVLAAAAAIAAVLAL